MQRPWGNGLSRWIWEAFRARWPAYQLRICLPDGFPVIGHGSELENLHLCSPETGGAIGRVEFDFVRNRE